MKYIKSILAVLFCVGILASCNEWLDVNVNPETPTSDLGTIETRLPWCEYYVALTEGVAGFRSYMQCGDWTRVPSSNYYPSSVWSPASGITTTAYQQYFVGAACNFEDLYDKAMAQGAYHYAGCVRVFRAMGYMAMTDLYGEMPYTEACGPDETPAYDDGKTIFMGCLAELDSAITLFGKSQEAGTPALSTCDWWNGGDVAKWTKLCYLLKARYGVKLIKKGAGDIAQGKYDSAKILEFLSKGPQSINDDTAFQPLDAGTSFRVAIYGDPSDICALYSVLGMNSGYMVTKALVDNLTNFDGKGIEDPRADKIIPWQYSIKSEKTPADVKYVGNWRRSIGVDLVSSSTPTLGGSGPIRSSYANGKGWNITSDNPARLGDTLYVEATCGSTGYGGEPDLFNRRVSGDNNSRESGTFYARAITPQFLGTYAEACFIKAEVLFNSNKKAEAFEAYKAGIQASFDMMNKVLKTWDGVCGDLSCPSFGEMTKAAIDAYMNNAIGTQSDLTLGKIMTQKKLALPFSLQIWNDMRRYDYNPEIFFNWAIPYNYTVSAASQKAIPLGKTWRRWQQCSHELNYNSVNLQEIGNKVPGANMASGAWNNQPDVWTIPVWWDSDQN